MIGFYNVSVILTYLGLASSVFGMFLSVSGEFTYAVICMLVSCVCDMFDGKVARAIERTDDAKMFGIQIDSLCDLVCFGAFPAVFCYCIGLDSAVGQAILIAFVLAGVIRLGYFNVTEQTRQQETAEMRRYYQGLPITSIAGILPVFYLLRSALDSLFIPMLGLLMIIVAVLYVADFRIKKLGSVACFIVLGCAVLLSCALVVLKALGLI